MKLTTGVVFGLLILISACSNDAIDYAGQYMATGGDDCTPDAPTTTVTANDLIEIVQQGQGGDATYIVNIPMAGAINLPSISQPASLNDEGALHFTFLREGKSGLFGGEPSINVTMVFEAHSDKENHIWLTRWDAVMGMLGETQTISPLENLRQTPGLLGEKGLCLSKLSNT